MTRIGATYTAIALALAIPAYALAQQQTEQPAAEQAGQQLAQEDRQFAEQAAMSDMAEIEAGGLAEEKGQSEEVKAFGSKMVEDHTTASQRLKEIAQGKGIELPAELDDQHRQKIDQLSALSGPEFDAQYTQGQVEMHQQAVDLFTRHAEEGQDADLKTFAQETLPILEGHLKEAQELQQSMGASGLMAQTETGAGTAATGEEAGAQTQASGTISIDQFMGKQVVGGDGQELGDVADIIVDPETGEAQQLVISSGGFLGIGEKEIAVDFAEAEMDPQNQVVSVSSITQADVEAMEEFVRTDDMMSYGEQQGAGGGPTQPTEPPAQQ